MKKCLIKFLKGYFILIGLSLMIGLFSFVFQSCSNENYYEDDSAIDRTVEIQKFKDSMKNFSNKANKSLTNKSNTTNREELAIAFVQEVEQDALLLLRSYGITDQQLIEEFGSLDSAKITLAAQGVTVAEDLIDNGKTLSIFIEEDYEFMPFFGLNSTYGQSDTVGGCIADAIGITAAFEVIERGIAGLGQRGVLKIIRKIGGKYLGAVGAVLAAYDFADCMGWIFQVGGPPSPGNVSSCNDLIVIDRVSTSFAATYYISKNDINYVSPTQFTIDKNQLYNVYSVDFGYIQNPQCIISLSGKVMGGALDATTIREISVGLGIE